jgi:hypothetical protein
LLQVIQSRFPTAPESLATRVGRVRNQAHLDELIKQAAVANSREEIERQLSR